MVVSKGKKREESADYESTQLGNEHRGSDDQLVIGDLLCGRLWAKCFTCISNFILTTLRWVPVSTDEETEARKG